MSVSEPLSDRALQISLNGQPRSLAVALTLTELLEQEQLAGKRVAVELNGEIVPRSRHHEQQLKHGDRVEIVHAIGGG